jgi:metal-responsive CopG/Arc/MetJ family transcriptional regulator
MKRGAITTTRSTFVGAWVPNDLLPYIDEAVRRLDSDRSKFIRTALRNELERALPPKRRSQKLEAA